MGGRNWVFGGRSGEHDVCPMDLTVKQGLFAKAEHTHFTHDNQKKYVEILQRYIFRSIFLYFKSLS